MKKIFACRFEYIIKQGTIKNASRYSKNANALANDFKQFLASCHVQPQSFETLPTFRTRSFTATCTECGERLKTLCVQQVNNLYVFIIRYSLIVIVIDTWNIIQFIKKKEFSQITEIKIDAT